MMDGVGGGRLGRSSSRFAPAASAFTGRVRKWTKRWVPLPPTPPNKTGPSTNGSGNEVSPHLILFKWTPSPSSSSNSSSASSITIDVDDRPPKRKLRYVPVSVTKEQKQAAAENSDSKAYAFKGKPDVDDDYMEEAQAADKGSEHAEAANQTKLDLNLS